MKQIMVRSKSGLLNGLELAAQAAEKFGAAISLLRNTPLILRAVASALFLAAGNYDTGRQTLRTRRAELRSLLKATRRFLRKSREALKEHLGEEHSPGWIPAGYRLSFTISRKVDELVLHLQTLHDFLEANPGYENAPLNVTAAEADMLLEKLPKALFDFKEQEAAVVTLVQANKDAHTAARQQMSLLLDELTVALKPLDGRWKAFGFNLPGAAQTPDVPLNLVAVLLGTNAVSLKWDAAPRAEYYRVWKRVLGVEEELVAVGSPGDRDFTIEGLPAASQVEVAVSAVNNGGESQTSEVKKIITL